MPLETAIKSKILDLALMTRAAWPDALDQPTFGRTDLTLDQMLSMSPRETDDLAYMDLLGELIEFHFDYRIGAPSFIALESGEETPVADALETLVVQLLALPEFSDHAMQIGEGLWAVIDSFERGSNANDRVWRIIHRAIKLASSNEPMLKVLACC